MRYCDKCIRKVHYADEINENEARLKEGTYVEYVNENKCECSCHRYINVPKNTTYKMRYSVLDRTCEDCGYVASSPEALRDHMPLCFNRHR